MRRAKPREIIAHLAYDRWYNFQDKFIWGGLWCFHAELFAAIDETYFKPYLYDIVLNEDYTQFKKIARLNDRNK